MTDTSGAGTSDGHAEAVSEALNNNENSNDTYSSHFLTNDNSSFSSDQTLKYANGQEFKSYGDLGAGGPLDVNQSRGNQGKSNDLENYTGGLVRFPYRTSDHSIALRSKGSQDFESNISQLSSHQVDESHSREEKYLLEDYTTSNAHSSHVSVTTISPQNSIGTVMQSEPSYVSGSNSSSLYEGTFLL